MPRDRRDNKRVDRKRPDSVLFNRVKTPYTRGDENSPTRLLVSMRRRQGSPGIPHNPKRRHSAEITPSKQRRLDGLVSPQGLMETPLDQGTILKTPATPVKRTSFETDVTPVHLVLEDKSQIFEEIRKTQFYRDFQKNPGIVYGLAPKPLTFKWPEDATREMVVECLKEDFGEDGFYTIDHINKQFMATLGNSGGKLSEEDIEELPLNVQKFVRFLFKHKRYAPGVVGGKEGDCPMSEQIRRNCKAYLDFAIESYGTDDEFPVYFLGGQMDWNRVSTKLHLGRSDVSFTASEIRHLFRRCERATTESELESISRAARFYDNRLEATLPNWEEKPEPKWWDEYRMNLQDEPKPKCVQEHTDEPLFEDDLEKDWWGEEEEGILGKEWDETPSAKKPEGCGGVHTLAWT